MASQLSKFLSFPKKRRSMKLIKSFFIAIFVFAHLCVFEVVTTEAQLPIRIPRIRTNNPTTPPQPNQNQTNTQTQGGGDQAEMRRNFLNEFRKYQDSVYALMQIHDPKLKVGNTSYGPPVSKDVWIKVMKELTEMDAACRSKYAGMQDDPSRISWGDLNHLPATWCAIAAKREEYANRGKTVSVNSRARHITGQITKMLDDAEKDEEERIGLEVQQMFWETDKWRSRWTEKLKPAFDEMEAVMPNDYLDSYIERGNAIKDKRIKAGESRKFTQPPHRDAVAENWIKQQYMSTIPGIQVLKIGSTYQDWRVFTNRVNIPTARYKRGWALIKLPNHPMCQAREWIIKQDYSGGGRYTANKVDSLGYTGILMQCN